MVTARIPAPMRVVVQADACWWWCQVCGFASRMLPWRDALALAADEGRAHLRAVHLGIVGPLTRFEDVRPVRVSDAERDAYLAAVGGDSAAHTPDRGEVEAFFADEACKCCEPLSVPRRADMALGYPEGVFVAPRPVLSPSTGSLRPGAPRDATGAPLTPTTALRGTSCHPDPRGRLSGPYSDSPTTKETP